MLLFSGFALRGPDGLLALSIGLVEADLVIYEYTVSGAGMGSGETVRFRWNPDFWSELLDR
jgi:cellulose synthase (UDP-forming)